MTKPERKFRLKQFGMRGLLVVITSLAVMFSWLAIKADQRRREDFVVDAIKQSCNCDVSFELMYDERPRWNPTTITPAEDVSWCDWLDWFVRDSVCDRTVLSVRGKISDAGLKRISELTRLRVLIIDRWSSITDDGLQPLSTLHGLEHLCLGTSLDTSTDLRCLAGMAELHTLKLWHFRPSLAGWQAIRSLGRLKSLEIDLGEIGTDVMSQLPTLTHISQLSIGELNWPTELDWLDRLPPQLKGLVIDGQLTDEEAPLLSNLMGLDYLVLGGTHVTARGVRELQRALPACTVEGPDPAVEP